MVVLAKLSEDAGAFQPPSHLRHLALEVAPEDFPAFVASLRERGYVGCNVTVPHKRAVWDAVDRLPDRQRAVVYLRYRADLGYEEIGAVMGISAVSARSHASRAMDRLAAILPEEDFR
jgi:DNA-directed RNA polymerase specialized sigma24 family protein